VLRTLTNSPQLHIYLLLKVKKATYLLTRFQIFLILEFRPYVPPALTPSGRLTYSYRSNTFEASCNLHREHLAANGVEVTFKRSHKQFIDKVLCQMEEDRLRKLERTTAYLQSTKGTLGFSENFGLSDNHQSNESKNSKPQTKIRVVNRMSLFESLLAESEVPPNVKRYGIISSPPKGKKRDEAIIKVN